MTTDSRDIVERLRKFEQQGQLHPVDDDERVTALMNEAADLIERLRSIAGKADVGQSFREIADKHGLQTGAPND